MTREHRDRGDPALLHSVWDGPTYGTRRPVFRHNVEVADGAMAFDPEDRGAR